MYILLAHIRSKFYLGKEDSLEKYLSVPMIFLIYRQAPTTTILDLRWQF